MELQTMTLNVSREIVPDMAWFVFQATTIGQALADEEIARAFTALVPTPTLSDDRAWQGLALSRRVCQAMHGDITIDRAPGTGTIFTLRLPADVQAMSDAAN
jgi:K+-sensing histidine kinase KdpD